MKKQNLPKLYQKYSKVYGDILKHIILANMRIKQIEDLRNSVYHIVIFLHF